MPKAKLYNYLYVYSIYTPRILFPRKGVFNSSCHTKIVSCDQQLVMLSCLRLLTLFPFDVYIRKSTLYVRVTYQPTGIEIFSDAPRTTTKSSIQHRMQRQDPRLEQRRRTRYINYRRPQTCFIRKTRNSIRRSTHISLYHIYTKQIKRA